MPERDRILRDPDLALRGQFVGVYNIFHLLFVLSLDQFVLQEGLQINFKLVWHAEVVEEVLIEAKFGLVGPDSFGKGWPIH